MSRFDRALLERDLTARSQLGRFGLVAQSPEPIQMALPGIHALRGEQNDLPIECAHAGTGRAPQKRLFHSGWITVCTRCGQEV